MKPLKEQIDELRAKGYSALLASAKVVHDVILLAIGRSGFKANGTLKGGVVMSALTRDIRRRGYRRRRQGEAAFGRLRAAVLEARPAFLVPEKLLKERRALAGFETPRVGVVEDVVASVGRGEYLAVVSGAVEEVVRAGGKDRLGESFCHRAPFAVDELAVYRAGTADGEVVGVVAVVSAGDEQIPPSLAEVQIRAFPCALHLVLRTAHARHVDRLRPWFYRQPVGGELDPVDAVRQRAEEHPHAAVDGEDIRVDGVPHAVAAAVDDLVRKLERTGRRIGGQRGNPAVRIAHEKRDIEDPLAAKPRHARRPDVVRDLVQTLPGRRRERVDARVLPVDQVAASADCPQTRRHGVVPAVAAVPHGGVWPIGGNHRVGEGLGGRWQRRFGADSAGCGKPDERRKRDVRGCCSVRY